MLLLIPVLVSSTVETGFHNAAIINNMNVHTVCRYYRTFGMHRGVFQLESCEEIRHFLAITSQISIAKLVFQLGHFAPNCSLLFYIAPSWELRIGNETSGGAHFFVTVWIANEFGHFSIERPPCHVLLISKWVLEWYFFICALNVPTQQWVGNIMNFILLNLQPTDMCDAEWVLQCIEIIAFWSPI